MALKEIVEKEEGRNILLIWSNYRLSLLSCNLPIFQQAPNRFPNICPVWRVGREIEFLTSPYIWVSNN